MPKNNFKKTAIRKRMLATGESYSVAARSLAKLDWWDELGTVIGEDQFYERPELFLVAARPGIGRTTVAVNIADRLARAGKKVEMVSNESTLNEMAARLVSVRTGINLGDVMEGKPEYVERIAEAQKTLGDIYLSDNQGGSLRTLRERIQKNGMKGSILIIDYLQLFVDDSIHNVQDSLSDAFAHIRGIQYDWGITVILLAQSNKLFDSEREGIHNLHSSAVENSDVVIMLDRDNENNQISLDVVKNKSGSTHTLEATIPLLNNRPLAP